MSVPGPGGQELAASSPGGRELTGEQQLAVARRDGPLLLAANAGAGKTTVLVERFVRDVLESREAEREGRGEAIACTAILAITFTRKAAGELRARIRERFDELGERELAREVERAWISTIDGFCARVLRAHAPAAGLDPSFTVLDEAELRALAAAAFDDGVGAVLEDPRTIQADLLALLGGLGYDGLRETIARAYERLRNEGIARPAVPIPPKPDPAGARTRLLRAAHEALEHLEPCPAGIRIDQARERLRGCIDALEAGSGGVIDADGWYVGRGSAALKEPALDEYRGAVQAAAQASGDSEAHGLVVVAAALLERYGAALDARKAAAAGLDFTDLALRTRDLLRDEPAVAAGYRKRLRRVMVDEFQDTNRLQLELLDALGIEDRFMVGDAMQSIYGFRSADVEAFRLQRSVARAGSSYAELRANFRSHPEILALVNAAFGAAHGEDYVPLEAGLDPSSDGAAHAELLLTDADAWAQAPPEGLLEGLPAGTRPGDAAEALLIAARVRELVDGGHAHAGEIAVLVRAGAKMPLLERALQRAGLPVVAAQGRGWWGRLEVLDLLAHLRVLLNRRDEEALLGVLASPLCGATPDTLALLAIDRREHGDGFADALARADTGASGPAAAIAAAQLERLRAYSDWAQGEREAMAWATSGELLERALHEGGYGAGAARLPGGPRRIANARKLVRLAQDFGARSEGGVRAFVDHAAEQLAARVPTSDAPVATGESDAVRLMTIHGAKGLEFPVVVLADLGRRTQDSRPRMIVASDRVGLRVITVDRRRHDAFAFAELRDAQREQDRGEERRIIHVAVTRAERLLVLSAVLDDLSAWPRESATAPPIAWMGPGLVADPATLQTGPSAGPVAIEVAREGWRAPLQITTSTPQSHGAALLSVSRVAATGERLSDPAAPDPSRRVASAAAGPPPAPAAVSYSSLSEYQRCAYRWYLRRRLHLPERDGRDLAALAPRTHSPQARQRGVLAHALLEYADLSAGAAAPEPERVRELAAALEIEVDEAAVAEQRGLVEAVLDGPLRERLAGARRELPFDLDLGGDAPLPMLTGVIDALSLEDGGTALVVDYKTDALEPGTDLEAAVAADYGLQRAAYALAALRAGAAGVDVVHLYLERPQAPVLAHFEAADAPRLEALLREQAGAIVAGRFPVSERPWAGLCATCPGRGGLCSHSDAQTSAPQPPAEPAWPVAVQPPTPGILPAAVTPQPAADDDGDDGELRLF